MNWNVVAQLTLIVNRDDGRMLHISLVRAIGEGWVGVVVEGQQPNDMQPASETIASTLESHAHAQLPPMPSLPEATAQAEKYAKWWQRSRATHEDCPCDVIGSTIAAAPG